MAICDFADQIEPQGIGAEPIRGIQWIHDGAQGLAHFFALEVDESMSEDLLRNGHTGAHQHRGPDDGVKASDVLADDMEVRRPPLREELVVLAETHGGNVIDECIEPDVDHALRVE